MSMLTCPRCKTEYSDAFQLAALCPNCNSPMVTLLAELGCLAIVLTILLGFLALDIAFLGWLRIR